MRVSPWLLLPAAVATCAAHPSPFQDRGPLARLLRALSLEPRGALVVLDTQGGGSLTARMRRRLGDDALADFHIPLLELPLDKGGTLLQAREGWGPEPRWALMDAKGKVLCSGTEEESPQALAERFEGAGWIPPSRPLEALLARSPDHTEAKEALLALRLRASMVRMAPLLVRRPSEGEEAPLPTLLRPLSETEDAQIWGTSALALDLLLKDAHWQGRVDFLPLEARFSELMQRTARRHLRSVEALLLRNPAQTHLWLAWIGIAAVAGHLEPGPLLAQLPPLPAGHSQRVPGGIARRIIGACRHLQAWAPLRDFLLRHLEAERGAATEEFRTMVGYEGMRWGNMSGAWKLLHGPLVEALLRLGEVSRAEAVLEELEARRRYEGVYTFAAEVAERCGERNLAESWRGKGLRLAAQGKDETGEGK